ncbi:hypothetical protein ACEN9X_17055 [Mucilaginibacter sp. Mucisp86]|uniref:hypothetical protein n=1 Tax=Mucilaginibacter sp. Mucisp86 TaxID=3243060 RepID=UPI0039B48886
MRYFRKENTSAIVSGNLSYENVSDRNKIRKALIKEQSGFCAYSERYIKHTDSVDIEHFDPREKNTTNDGYYNWYATLHWLNSHKPKFIEPFLPILIPYDIDIKDRIKYEDGIFVPLNADDIEAQNLIDFLGVNKAEVYSDRAKHINRIRTLKALCADNDLFLRKMIEDQDNLSFATALESVFELDVDDLIEKSLAL